MPKEVQCVECERTFYAEKFKGRFLPNAKGVCQWCLDPTLSVFDEGHEPPPPDDSNGTVYRIGKAGAKAVGRCRIVRTSVEEE